MLSEAALAVIEGAVGVDELTRRLVEHARFDTLGPDGRIVHHHVFAAEVRWAKVRALDGQTLRWFDLAALPTARSGVVVLSPVGAGVVVGSAVSPSAGVGYW